MGFLSLGSPVGQTLYYWGKQTVCVQQEGELTKVCSYDSRDRLLEGARDLPLGLRSWGGWYGLPLFGPERPVGFGIF